MLKSIMSVFGADDGDESGVHPMDGKLPEGAPASDPPARIQTFHCPERGEAFEAYVVNLVNDFRAYDPGFRIDRWLGSGGFCDVFHVPEVHIPGKGVREAVLRVLRPTLYRTTNPLENNRVIRLFLTELSYNMFLTSQNVPNVVKMLDFGFFGRGPGKPRHFYMLSEFIDGRDVGQRLLKRPTDEKELVKRVVFVNLIAGIMGELHFRGIIHCDLKPTNIIVRHDEPFLTDFGSARWMRVQDAIAEDHMQVLGTPSHMSYEQLEGRFYQIDQRTDIFSLAVMAAYAFTGVHPFAARAEIDISRDGIAALAAVEPDVPSIPYRGGEKLRSFLLECLERDMDGRPPSMASFQHRLNSWILEN